MYLCLQCFNKNPPLDFQLNYTLPVFPDDLDKSILLQVLSCLLIHFFSFFSLFVSVFCHNKNGNVFNFFFCTWLLCWEKVSIVGPRANKTKQWHRVYNGLCSILFWIREQRRRKYKKKKQQHLLTQQKMEKKNDQNRAAVVHHLSDDTPCVQTGSLPADTKSLINVFSYWW